MKYLDAIKAIVDGVSAKVSGAVEFGGENHRFDEPSLSKHATQDGVDYAALKQEVLDSQNFKALQGKTQIALDLSDSIDPNAKQSEFDRWAHSQIVALDAKQMAMQLGLNVDLAEVIGLTHDCGHTPGGHAGEHALKKLTSGDTATLDAVRETYAALDQEYKTQGFNHHLQAAANLRLEGIEIPEVVEHGIAMHGADEFADRAKGVKITELAENYKDAIDNGGVSLNGVNPRLGELEQNESLQKLLKENKFTFEDFRKNPEATAKQICENAQKQAETAGKEYKEPKVPVSSRGLDYATPLPTASRTPKEGILVGIADNTSSTLHDIKDLLEQGLLTRDDLTEPDNKICALLGEVVGKEPPVIDRIFSGKDGAVNPEEIDKMLVSARDYLIKEVKEHSKEIGNELNISMGDKATKWMFELRDQNYAAFEKDVIKVQDEVIKENVTKCYKGFEKNPKAMHDVLEKKLFAKFESDKEATRSESGGKLSLEQEAEFTKKSNGIKQRISDFKKLPTDQRFAAIYTMCNDREINDLAHQLTQVRTVDNVKGRLSGIRQDRKTNDNPARGSPQIDKISSKLLIG